MGKDIKFGSEARSGMQAGLNKLADAVKATLGPRGRHVAIEMPYGPPLITKDGVTVAKAISLDDRLENMGSQLVKYVASATNGIAGDGTTTATVLAQSIFSEGSKMISSGHNPVLVKRGMDKALSAAIESLSDLSIKVSDIDTISNVASISANNDRELGSLISSVIESIGDNGIIHVEEATGAATSVEYTEGLQIDRGYFNHGFVTNSQKMTVEFDNPLILCCSDKISSTSDLLSILESVSESGRSLLIIAKLVADEALQTLLLNNARGSLKCCVIRSPGFGDIGVDMLDDIATICGTSVFNQASNPLCDVTIDSLGAAKRVYSNQNSTSIINGAGSGDSVSSKIESITSLLSQTNEAHMIVAYKDRLSKLSGGVALIKVGGTTESEMHEKKDRVEDSINSVMAAISDGVVPGGGAALVHASYSLEKDYDKSALLTEERVGFDIVISAMQSPFKQILKNAGFEHYKYLSLIQDTGGFSGYDALTNEFVEDMLAHGVIDPLKVVKTALEHAVSASGTLLTTEVSIFDSDNKEVLNS